MSVRGAHHYLLKLERGESASTYMFVYAGSTAEMLVPLGSYTLKYATGKVDAWCGPDNPLPFGSRTSFHPAQELFAFTDEGSHYSGYTLELYLQPDGNLGPSRSQHHNGEVDL